MVVLRAEESARFNSRAHGGATTVGMAREEDAKFQFTRPRGRDFAPR